jgi:hypothetical protein
MTYQDNPDRYIVDAGSLAARATQGTRQLRNGLIVVRHLNNKKPKKIAYLYLMTG